MTLLDRGYGSHFPVLAAMLAATRGPVLEMGSGIDSTPMLSLMCRMMNRPLTTYETSGEWHSKLSPLFTHEWVLAGGDPDRFRHEGAFEKEWPFASRTWGLAFVDFYPGEARKDAIRLLSDKADVIVVHDAECDGRHGGGGNYQYDLVTPLFKSVAYYRIMKPVTLVLSNRMEVKFERGEE